MSDCYRKFIEAFPDFQLVSQSEQAKGNPNLALTEAVDFA